MLIIIPVSCMNFILPKKNDLIENIRKLISCTYICSPVGQRFVEFPVEILHNDDIEWHESFRVLLGPEDPSGASLGDRALVTVTILDDEVSGSLVFPAPPMVGFVNSMEDSNQMRGINIHIYLKS